MKPSTLLAASLAASFPGLSAGQSTCASAAGTWTCAGSPQFACNSVLALSQSPTGTISGTDTVNEPGCPVRTWNTSGTFLGNGQARTTSNNPHGTGDWPTCVAQIVYEFTVKKPGCHTAEGTWRSGWGSLDFSSTFTLSKPCDVPTGESTASAGWDIAIPTRHRWRATLSPSTINFDGRTIGEDNPGGATDTCWFSGSLIPYQNDVTGSTGTVVSNQYDDLVGWHPDAVTYYRGQGRAPCGMSTVQRVSIDCATNNPTVINNALSLQIGVTTVSSSRAGQTAMETWP